MKNRRSITGVLYVLAIGLMFLSGATQAQTMEHPGRTMERPVKAFISDENDTDT